MRYRHHVPFRRAAPSQQPHRQRGPRATRWPPARRPGTPSRQRRQRRPGQGRGAVHGDGVETAPEGIFEGTQAITAYSRGYEARRQSRGHFQDRAHAGQRRGRVLRRVDAHLCAGRPREGGEGHLDQGAGQEREQVAASAADLQLHPAARGAAAAVAITGASNYRRSRTDWLPKGPPPFGSGPSGRALTPPAPSPAARSAGCRRCGNTQPRRR